MKIYTHAIRYTNYYIMITFSKVNHNNQVMELVEFNPREVIKKA